MEEFEFVVVQEDKFERNWHVMEISDCQDTDARSLPHFFHREIFSIKEVSMPTVMEEMKLVVPEKYEFECQEKLKLKNLWSITILMNGEKSYS